MTRTTRATEAATAVGGGVRGDDRGSAQRGGLRRLTVRGTIVNALFLVAINSLTLLKGFVVAGLIATTDYGLWGILTVALATLMWLKRAAIGGKYVQQSETDQELAFQKAFTFEAIVTGGLLVLLIPMLFVLALGYGRGDLIAPGLCLALVLPATLLTAPAWVFYRRMEFVKQRTLLAIDPVVGFAVSVGLALAGAGYWSLVLGMVAGACASALAAFAASPYRLAFRYDGDSAREYLNFSWPLLVSSVASIVLAQGSVIVGQATLGLAAVGAITLASTVSLYADRIDSIVTETLYPAICAVKDRDDLLFEAFVKSNRLGLMWAVPFGVALALFAPDLVHFGIGDKWEPAVILLQTFGLTAAAGHVGYNWHAFYRARGSTRPMAVVSVVTMLAFLAAPVPLIIAYGLPGFAAGMAVMTAVMLTVRTIYILKLFPHYSFLQHAARAIAPSIPATAVVLVARLLEGSDRSLSLALAELGLYSAVTVGATLLLERKLLREIMGHLRRSPSPASGLAV